MNKQHVMYTRSDKKQSLKDFIHSSAGLFVAKKGFQPVELLVHPNDLEEAKKATKLSVSASSTVPFGHIKLA
jgi:hypothetical protein